MKKWWSDIRAFTVQVKIINKRKKSRSIATWRRTVEKEIKAMGLTWGEAEMAALDRIGWR